LLPGDIVKVRITKVLRHSLEGKLIKESSI